MMQSLKNNKFFMMLKYFYKRSIIDIQLFKYRNTFSSLDDYKNYLIKNSIEHYADIFFTDIRDTSKERILTLFKGLKIDLNNKSFIDFGPEVGESLDIARSQNAKVIDFIDYNKHVIIYNELRGYNGIMMDYLKDQQRWSKISSNKYDFILNVGALNADYINSSDKNLTFFRTFLTQLDRVLKDNGIIVICPTFEKNTELQEHYFGKSYYYCKDVEVFKKSDFFQIIKSFGYENVWIDRFNDEKCFPFTFIKTYNKK